MKRSFSLVARCLGPLVLLAACSTSSSRSKPTASGESAGDERSARPSRPEPGDDPVTPSDLLASPETYLDREVTVRILEPLDGPSTEEALARVEYGQVSIRSPSYLLPLVLVPASFRMGDPNRYKNKFDGVFDSPLEVRGVFLKDDALSKDDKHPRYVLRVSSRRPIDVGEPIRAPRIDEILAHKAYWDHRFIVYEGTYESRFEVSTLDDGLWLSVRPGVVTVGTAPERVNGTLKERVRVTGLLFAEEGRSYGHLGAAHAEIVASKIEHLPGT